MARYNPSRGAPSGFPGIIDRLTQLAGSHPRWASQSQALLGQFIEGLKTSVKLAAPMGKSEEEIVSARLHQFLNTPEGGLRGSEAILNLALRSQRQLRGKPFEKIGELEELHGMKQGSARGIEALIRQRGLEIEKIDKKNKATGDASDALDKFSKGTKGAGQSLDDFTKASRGITQAFEGAVTGNPRGFFSGLSQFAGGAYSVFGGAYAKGAARGADTLLGAEGAGGVMVGGGGGILAGLRAGGGALAKLVSGPGLIATAATLGAAVAYHDLHKMGMEGQNLPLTLQMMGRMGYIENPEDIVRTRRKGGLYTGQALNSAQLAYATALGPGGEEGARSLRGWIDQNQSFVRTMGYTSDNLDQLGAAIAPINRAFNTFGGNIDKYIKGLTVPQAKQALAALQGIGPNLQMQYAGFGAPTSLIGMVHQMVKAGYDSGQIQQVVGQAMSMSTLQDPRKIAGTSILTGLSSLAVLQAYLHGDQPMLVNAAIKNMANPNSPASHMFRSALKYIDQTARPGTQKFLLDEARFSQLVNPDLYPAFMKQINAQKKTTKHVVVFGDAVDDLVKGLAAYKSSITSTTDSNAKLMGSLGSLAEVVSRISSGLSAQKTLFETGGAGGPVVGPSGLRLDSGKSLFHYYQSIHGINARPGQGRSSKWSVKTH